MNETARDRSPQSLENEIIALTHRLKCLRLRYPQAWMG